MNELSGQRADGSLVNWKGQDLSADKAWALYGGYIFVELLFLGMLLSASSV